MKSLSAPTTPPLAAVRYSLVEIPARPPRQPWTDLATACHAPAGVRRAPTNQPARTAGPGLLLFFLECSKLLTFPVCVVPARRPLVGICNVLFAQCCAQRTSARLSTRPSDRLDATRSHGRRRILPHSSRGPGSEGRAPSERDTPHSRQQPELMAAN